MKVIYVLILLAAFSNAVDPFTAAKTVATVINVAIKVVKFLNEPEPVNYEKLQEHIIESIKSQITATARIQTTIILDHQIQTHVQFPTKNLANSVVNYLQHPSNLSLAHLVQDCKDYRPSRILTRLDELLENTTDSWFFRYFETNQFEAAKVEQMSMKTVQLMQMLVWSNAFCLATNPGFDLTSSEMTQETKTFASSVEKVQNSLENHVLKAADHYFRKNNIERLFKKSWPSNFTECGRFHRVFSSDANYCSKYYKNFVQPLYDILVRKYGGFNDLFAVWLEQIGPFAFQPDWYRNNSIDFVSSDPNVLIDFEIDGFKVFVYRALKSAASLDFTNVDYSKKTNRFNRSRKVCLDDAIRYHKICRDYKFCDLLRPALDHSSLVQSRPILKRQKVSFCGRITLLVFGHRKNDSIETRGQDLIQSLRAKWEDFNNLHNPIPMPFERSLKFERCQTLHVQGQVKDHAKSFEVILLSGNKTIDSTFWFQAALHFDTKFTEGRHVINSLENGKGGDQVRIPLVFKPGQEFDLRIRALDDLFEIFGNRKKIHDFEYRFPVETIDHLNIRGDIALNHVKFGGHCYHLPYEAEFPTGYFNSGKRILISGIPHGSFKIDLIGKDDDILFHFNPRFKETAVVRNSIINGNWDREERAGVFPFEKHVIFDLILVNEVYSIQIFVNNKHFGFFAHRTGNPNFDYKKIQISGKLKLIGFSGHD